MKRAILPTLAVVAACGAGAQQVYRCGSSYSQQPCPGATVVETRPNDASAHDAARATAAAQADARRADTMEKARLAQEKNAPKATVIGPQAPGSAPIAKEAARKKPGKEKKPDHFTATVPGSAKPRK